LSRPSFVDALVADLTPARPATPWLETLFGWCLVSWLIVSVAILVTGPLREGILGEFLTNPSFALQLVMGLGAGLAAIWAGLEIGVPGAPPAWRLWTPPLVFLTGWVVLVGIGLADPNGVTSMDGKRAHCFIQTLLAAMPPFAIGLSLLRRRVIFARKDAGFLVGIAAAAIPALWMHVACIAEAGHVLESHLSSVLIVGLLGAASAHWILPRP
jgi:hypothetical protein